MGELVFLDMTAVVVIPKMRVLVWVGLALWALVRI
jgi:hypothetical protein